MPETPDFDQIARTLLGAVLAPNPPLDSALNIHSVVEQLRVVWNARGDADVDAIESPFMGLGPFREKVSDAIRTLDR